MPPASGSTPEVLAAYTDSTGTWTVKRSADTTVIDLGGVVISSSDPDFLCAWNGKLPQPGPLLCQVGKNKTMCSPCVPSFSGADQLLMFNCT
jgi:hypothetical protein